MLEQGLLSDIRCLSNDDFHFQQDGALALAQRSRHAHYRLPALSCARVHSTGKLAAKQSGSKFCGLLSVKHNKG